VGCWAPKEETLAIEQTSGRQRLKNWAGLCDSVTDNFRVISPKDFRVMT
jgi:hypothetical protein